MAGNTVIVQFIGEAGPLRRTLRDLDGAADRTKGGLLGLTKSIFAVGAVGSAVQTVAALGTSLAQMSGAALLAPAGILAAGAAITAGKLAAQGFSDALGGDAEALAGLAPSARATVDALTGMKTGWKAVQQAVQQNTFKDVAGDVKELGGAYLPMLKTGLGGIGTAFNNIARNALGALKTPEAMSSVKAVVDATGSSLGHMGESLGAGVAGFLNLAGAGAKFLAKTGGGITDLAFKFEAWTQRITNDGSFDRWVTAAGTAFGQLFGFIGNLGRIFTTVIGGLAGPTDGLFGSLQRVTGQILAFLQSVQGQQALATLGTALRQVSDVTSQVLAVALKQIGPLIQALAPVFAELATTIGGALTTAINIIGPALTGFANFLASMPGSASVLVGVLAGLWAAFVVGKGIIAATSVVSGVMAAWPTIVAVATGAWTAAQWLLNAALTANPIGIVVAAIALLVAGVVWAYNNIGWFKDAVDTAWQWIKTAFTNGVNFAKSAIAWFGELPGKIGNWFGQVKDWIVRKFGEAVAWIRGVPGKILSALGNLGGLLVNAGRSIIEGLWNGLKQLWENVKSWIGGIGDWIAQNKGPISYDVRLLVPNGGAIMQGLLRGLQGGFVPVQGYVSGVAGQLADSMSATAASGAAAANSAPSQYAPGARGGAPQVSFSGNISDGLAQLIMKLIREGKIQVSV